MSKRSNERGADADDGLALLGMASGTWSELASVRQLVDYLRHHSDEQVRTDMLNAADDLSLLAERLRSLLATTSVPSEPSTEPSATTVAGIAELEEQLEALQREVERLSAENHDLRRQLDVLGTESADTQRALTRERDSAQAQLTSARTEMQDLSLANQELEAENRKLQAKSASYASALVERDASPPDLAPEIEEAEAQFSIGGVIEMARDKLDRVEIPDAALREIDSLDADEKAADWARELWKGLSALNAYATESAHFQGGFWEWCEHSNSEHNLWPVTPKKLAMRESETVKNDGKLWRMRRFLISRKAAPTGYQHMEAHLKIAEGGGQHIPRLYFYDDTKGKTKQVHVGFIGPHRLVPNTNS